MVFDIDGCLYVGGDAVPGVSTALERIEARGFRTILATNNSTRHADDVSRRVADITGHHIPPTRVMTSALAAVRLLPPGTERVLVIGEAGLVSTLEQAGFTVTDDPEGLDAVVVGLDRSFDYTGLRRAMRAILGGAVFVATNRDATFPTGGVPEPGAGAIVAAVERATGITPTYAGKPEPAMIEAINELTGEGPVWCVGDRLDTDIAVGKAAGWRTVLVMTGVTSTTDDIPPHLEPDHVLASVADLPDLIGA